MERRAVRHRLPPVAAMLCLCAGPCLGQAFSEVTDVVAVEIPVQVIRDGEAVRGLTAADFEVRDGNKKQALTGFEVIDLGSVTRASQVPAAARRHFLLLFDLSFSDPKAVVGARRAARDLVLSGLHPADLVGVATYSAAQGAQLVLGFTSDRRQVDSALDSLGLGTQAARDPLRLTLAGRSGAPVRPVAERPPELEAQSTAALLGELGELGHLSQLANTAAQRGQVTAFTRSLTDLGRLLAAVAGRKYVVLLSQGFDTGLLTGTTEETRRAELQAAAAEEGGSARVDSDELYGSTGAANDVEKMLAELRRADCVIQAVDIGGLRAQGEEGPRLSGGGRDSLFQMARGTGGELYENTNDLPGAMAGMLGRTAVSYVLTFQPEGLRRDGSYRRLKVELKDAPRGTRVLHRPGYYAPKPFADMTPLEKLIEAATQLVVGQETGRVGAALLAAAFPGQGGKAYVPVILEVDGPGLLSGMKGEAALAAEIYVYAMDADGVIQDFFTQTLGLDLAKVEGALRRSGLKFFGHVDLAPGGYSVRALVRNAATGASSLRVARVEVPADPPTDRVLLPPLFPEPPDRWVLAREAPRGEARQPAYPFMIERQPYVPAAKPALGSGQEARVALVGYGWPPGDPQARGAVLTRDGKEAGRGELRLDREVGAGGVGGIARWAGVFKPPRLAPGEYVLQIELSDPGATRTSSIPFVVAR